MFLLRPSFAYLVDGTFHGLSITTRSKVKHSKSTSTDRVTIKTEVKVEGPSGNGPSHVDETLPISRRIRKKVKLAGMADDVAAGPNTNRRSPRVKEAKLESSGIRIKASAPRRVKPSRSSRVSAEGVLQQQQKRIKVEDELHAKISPILMERARLIVEIMDALYPTPPIPINHVVGCDFSSGSVYRHPCGSQSSNSPPHSVTATVSRCKRLYRSSHSQETKGLASRRRFFCQGTRRKQLNFHNRPSPKRVTKRSHFFVIWRSARSEWQVYYRFRSATACIVRFS